jgi:hypothetical protein
MIEVANRYWGRTTDHCHSALKAVQVCVPFFPFMEYTQSSRKRTAKHNPVASYISNPESLSDVGVPKSGSYVSPCGPVIYKN